MGDVVSFNRAIREMERTIKELESLPKVPDVVVIAHPAALEQLEPLGFEGVRRKDVLRLHYGLPVYEAPWLPHGELRVLPADVVRTPSIEDLPLRLSPPDDDPT